MIRSMTGYGRCEQAYEDKTIQVEIRSVNHRFFEFSSRIPRVYAFLEDKIKAYVQGRVSRGKVDVFVTINTISTPGTVVQVTHGLAAGYMAAMQELSEEFGLKKEVSLGLLTRFPDVLTVIKAPEDEEKLLADFMPVLEGAVDAFLAMREYEGERLQTDVLEKAENILHMVEHVESGSEALVREYNDRLKARLMEILGDANIDEQRIVTEAAIFADKTAVAEETVRLRSHISQLCELIRSDGAVGRKLDFLVQEMNREANTIGSKSQNLEITRTVVDIKSEIEKIREQIQNIE